MNIILEWVCNVAVYLILVTMILQIVPKRFRKYINFFTGILLIIIVINPATKLFDMEVSLASYFEVGEMKQQLSDMENMLKLTENVGEERLIENYNEQIRKNITEMIKAYGFRIIDIQVAWNLDGEAEEYGSIDAIYMTLEDKSTEGTIKIDPVKISIGSEIKENYTSDEIKKMKKLVADFYNMEEAHINIMIQG